MNYTTVFLVFATLLIFILGWRYRKSRRWKKGSLIIRLWRGGSRVVFVLVVLFVLYSWGGYTIGSRNIGRLEQQKNATLVKLTWVHPARKVVITDPEVLKSITIAVGRSKHSNLSPNFKDNGNLTFEFADGSYFTVGCEEGWSDQGDEVILGYNVWWDKDRPEWGWTPLRHVTLKEPNEVLNQIHGFFHSNIGNGHWQMMLIESKGKTKIYDTDKRYKSNEFKGYLDFWGYLHFRLGRFVTKHFNLLLFVVAFMITMAIVLRCGILIHKLRLDTKTQEQDSDSRMNSEADRTDNH